MMEEGEEQNRLVIKYKSLKKIMNNAEEEQKQLKKDNEKLMAEVKGVGVEVKELKTKHKSELDCSQSLKMQLNNSKDSHELIYPTLEQNLRKKAEEKKKRSWFNYHKESQKMCRTRIQRKTYTMHDNKCAHACFIHVDSLAKQCHILQ